MPSWLRNDIQGFLYDVATFFRHISYRFEDAADWVADIPAVGYYIAYALYKVQDYCYDANYVFKDLMWGWLDLCDWLDHVWDELGDLWDDLDTLWDYAHYTLRNLANDAWNLATDAWDYALAAYNLAIDALTEIPAWILEKLAIAYNLAATALQVVPAWIQKTFDNVNSSLTSLWDYAKTTVWNKAIDAWNYAANAWAHAEELFSQVVTISKDWVIGVIDDAKAWVLSAIAAPINLVNLWFDDIQNFFNDPLGWLWDRFADWFFGSEK